jgi:hypothetical protein
MKNKIATISGLLLGVIMSNGAWSYSCAQVGALLYVCASPGSYGTGSQLSEDGWVSQVLAQDINSPSLSVDSGMQTGTASANASDCDGENSTVILYGGSVAAGPLDSALSSTPTYFTTQAGSNVCWILQPGISAPGTTLGNSQWSAAGSKITT